MKLPRSLELPIDFGGLLVALVVDIVMNVICFATLAPDMITRIAFIAIGVMIVLFVPRSWSKRQYAAWAVFAAVVFFFDFSFALVATKVQATHEAVNVYSDAEVIRLDEEIELHNQNIIRLQEEHAISTRETTLAAIQSQVAEERREITRARNDRESRIAHLEKSASHESGITSDILFTAIPDAWRDGRYIELVVFGLIFIGLQLIVASSIDNKSDVARPASDTAHDDVEPPMPVITNTTHVTAEDIETFVKYSWYRVSAKTSEFILPRETFGEYMRKKGVQFTTDKYSRILDACVESGLVSTDGKITEPSKATAIKTLTARLQGGK